MYVQHIREANRKSPEAMQEWHNASLAQLVLLPCVPYLLWAVLYYIKARGPVPPCKVHLLLC